MCDKCQLSWEWVVGGKLAFLPLPGLPLVNFSLSQVSSPALRRAIAASPPGSLESSLFPPRASVATGEHDLSPLMREPFLSVAHLKLHLPSTVWSYPVHFTILPPRAALGKMRQRGIHSPLFQIGELLHRGQVASSPGLFPGL